MPINGQPLKHLILVHLQISYAVIKNDVDINVIL